MALNLIDNALLVNATIRRWTTSPTISPRSTLSIRRTPASAFPNCSSAVTRPSARVVARSMTLISDRLDSLDKWRRTKLAAKRHHRDPHCVGERICVLIPDLFQEQFRTHRSRALLHQYLQHPELFRCEADHSVGPMDHALVRVEPTIADLEHRRCALRRPATQRVDSRHELSEMERLDQIVVSPQAQPRHPLVERVERGQHQNPG